VITFALSAGNTRTLADNPARQRARLFAARFVSPARLWSQNIARCRTSSSMRPNSEQRARWTSRPTASRAAGAWRALGRSSARVRRFTPPPPCVPAAARTEPARQQPLVLSETVVRHGTSFASLHSRRMAGPACPSGHHESAPQRASPSAGRPKSGADRPPCEHQ
jgi:hypothetical protein